MRAFKGAGLARFGIGMKKNQAWAAGETRAPTMSVRARCLRDDICDLPSREDEIKRMLPAINAFASRAYGVLTPNVKVTGAARLYRAASGGPQGYVSVG